MSPDLAGFLENGCRLGADGLPVNAGTGRRVTALLPAQFYGLPADMKQIMEVADRFNLKVIEDACQAHGATYVYENEERRTGTFGRTAAFSFYPGKNLATGEGGAVVTNDLQASNNMRIWREHGQIERYVHVSPETARTAGSMPCNARYLALSSRSLTSGTSAGGGPQSGTWKDCPETKGLRCLSNREGESTSITFS